MSMRNRRIKNLIVKELRGDLMPEEQKELQQWANLSASNGAWYLHFRDKRKGVIYPGIMNRAATKKEHAKIEIDRQMEVASMGEGKVIKLWWRQPFGRVAAAVVVFLTVSAMWQYLRNKPTASPQLHVIVGNADDVLPGSNKAILTLANGSTITLDSAGNGTLVRQGSMRVVKLDSGVIAYRAESEADKEVFYNTISTPRGGQYKLILPDGSKVWLNAASALRYPTAFTGSTRPVELVSGEAYFEVTRHPSQPFTVRVPAVRQGDRDLTTDVLGTSFDLNAYPDEPGTKVTLLTGLVKVSNGKATDLLQPGEQVASEGGGAIMVDHDVNLADVVAWKEGLFSFNRAGIEVLMRQIARWYDVEVTYEGKIPARQFVGTIPRNVPLSVVLRALGFNDVHFRIEGKKIIVTP